MSSQSLAGTSDARFRPRGPQIRTLFRGMNLPDDMRPEFEFLTKIRDRKDFFELIEKKHPRGSEGYEFIRRTYNDSEQGHMGRHRHSGEKEFRHAFRCALILHLYCEVDDPVDIGVMFCHDLPETRRRKWNFRYMEARYGTSFAQQTMTLTKPIQRPQERKREVERRYYVGQLAKASRKEIMKKGVDALDNLMTLWKRSARRMWQKIDDVVRYLLPLLRKHRLTKLLKAIQAVLQHIRFKLHHGIVFAH